VALASPTGSPRALAQPDRSFTVGEDSIAGQASGSFEG
jgi:hypothetical protein